MAIFISQGVQQRHVHRSSCHISPHLEQWCFVILIVRHSVCIWMLQSKAYLHVFLCLCQIFCLSDIQKAFWKRLLFWSWDIVFWECNPVPLYIRSIRSYIRVNIVISGPLFDLKTSTAELFEMAVLKSELQHSFYDNFIYSQNIGL